MGSFINTIVTSSPLGLGDDKGLTYLVATNAGQLTYLID